MFLMDRNHGDNHKRFYLVGIGQDHEDIEQFEHKFSMTSNSNEIKIRPMNLRSVLTIFKWDKNSLD